MEEGEGEGEELHPQTPQFLLSLFFIFLSLSLFPSPPPPPPPPNICDVCVLIMFLIHKVNCSSLVELYKNHSRDCLSYLISESYI